MTVSVRVRGEYARLKDAKKRVGSLFALVSLPPGAAWRHLPAPRFRARRVEVGAIERQRNLTRGSPQQLHPKVMLLIR